MKKTTILDLSGERLFIGARNEVKNFIKLKKLKRGTYTLHENYVEKVVVQEEEEEDFIEDITNNLAKPTTKEGFFNRAF